MLTRRVANQWRRANSRALLSDLNATAVSIRHGRCREVFAQIASIVFKQALLEVTRYAGVVNCRVCMTHQNINNEIFISWPAKPYSLERAKKVKTAPPFSTLLPRGSPESFRGWARQDSNLGPRDYESPALTAELQAHHALAREHPTFNVQRPIFDSRRVLRRNFGLPAAAAQLIAD